MTYLMTYLTLVLFKYAPKGGKCMKLVNSEKFLILLFNISVWRVCFLWLLPGTYHIQLESTRMKVWECPDKAWVCMRKVVGSRRESWLYHDTALKQIDIKNVCCKLTNICPNLVINGVDHSELSYLGYYGYLVMNNHKFPFICAYNMAIHGSIHS